MTVPPRTPSPTATHPPSPVSQRRRGHVWLLDDIDALGATADLVTAASILGIGRTAAYALAKAEQFPVPVLRAGRRYVVPIAPLRALLGIETAPSRDLATGIDNQEQVPASPRRTRA